jgi:hypothetical protein
VAGPSVGRTQSARTQKVRALKKKLELKEASIWKDGHLLPKQEQATSEIGGNGLECMSHDLVLTKLLTKQATPSLGKRTDIVS